MPFDDLTKCASPVRNRIKLKPLLDPKEREVMFDNIVSAANYELEGSQTSANGG